MKKYRIVSAVSGEIVAEKNHRSDNAAKNWLDGLLIRGVVSGSGVRLQHRTMTDAQAAALPPFADGQRQSAWAT